MSIIMQINPFDFFTDTHGDALDAGYIYVGEPNKDPRQYPVAVYYDAALTIPAAMPLRTSNGYIVRNGAPTFLYIDGNYSIIVQNKNHAQVFYVPDFLMIGNNQAATMADLLAIIATLNAGQIAFRGITVQRALDSFISVDWYGAVSDGVADDTTAIRDAIAAAVSRGIQDVYLGADHMISSTITIPVGIFLRGQGRSCRIHPSDSGTFTGGWMFFINSTDGTNWTVPFPNTLTGGIKDCTFYNTNATTNRRGVKGFGAVEISDLRGFNMSQMVGRPTGLYSDNFSVRNVYCEPVIGTDWQVDIRGLGDGLLVEGLHFPYNPVNPGGGTPKALFIGGALGGNVNACIGGDVRIENASISITNGHHERAQLQIDSANVDLKDTVFGATTRVPIALSQVDQQNYVFTMTNVEFLYTEGLLTWQGRDLQVAGRYTVEVDGCYRRHSSNTDLTKSQITGILVENSSGVPLSDWNDFSYQLSKKGRILPAFFVERNFQTYFTSNGFPGPSSASADSTTTFTGATGTYYYRTQLLLDRNRLVGRNDTSGEKSVALTNGGSGARLDIDFGGRAPTGIIRVYRGTSPGSYDNFIDIQAYNVGRLYDAGLTLNGYPWDARAASGVGPINSLGEESILIDGERAMFVAVTAPTVGTWRQNDAIEHSNVAASGKRGRLCTTSGATGVFVFKTWGAIDA